jgi:hypothetical protein
LLMGIRSFVPLKKERGKKEVILYIQLKNLYLALRMPRFLSTGYGDLKIGGLHVEQKNHGLKNPRCTGICPTNF